jgi:hypothetical protein
VKAAVVLLLVLVACGTDDAPASLRPFAPVDWDHPVSDEELVRAMVGRGGTRAQRAQVARLARELLPILADAKDGPRSPAETYKDLAESLSFYRRTPDPVARFAIVVVDHRALYIAFEAHDLAWSRAAHELWPDEPIGSDRAAAIDPSTWVTRANELALELDRIRGLTEDIVPDLWRQSSLKWSDVAGARGWICAARNDIRVALGQGYARVNGPLRQRLEERGMAVSSDCE